MGSSENDQNQFILLGKVLGSVDHDSNTGRSVPLSPLQPHTEYQNSLPKDGVPSLKRKRASSPPLPPTGRQIHTSNPGFPSLDPSPTKALSVTTYDHRSAAPITPSSTPPIAFLREPSESVSPVLSARQDPPSTDVFSRPVPAVPSASFTNAQDMASALKQNSASILRAPSSFTLFTAPTHHKLAARTRTETGASAHEPAPSYYKYDSLPAAPGAYYRDVHGGHAFAREVEAACETVEAPIGVLGGPPIPSVDAATALVKTLREQILSRNAQKQPDIPGELRPNTAPTAAYLALLDETFGAGSALRGEGAKPGPALQKRNNFVGVPSPTMKVASLSMTVSGASDRGGFDEMEVDSEDTETRAGAWIADIEALVKGKREFTRQVRLELDFEKPLIQQCNRTSDCSERLCGILAT